MGNGNKFMVAAVAAASDCGPAMVNANGLKMMKKSGGTSQTPETNRANNKPKFRSHF